MDKAKRLFMAICILAFTQTAYGIIQKIAHHSSLNLITPLDEAIPLQPWTILVYASIFITLVGAGWILEHQVFILTFKRVLAAELLSFIVFWRMSVDYPRPDPAMIENGIYHWGFELMHRIDGPNNTFPSLHVSLTCIVMHQLWKHGFNKWGCIIYAVLVCLSTLFTKQHFFYDVIGGVVVYLATLQICKPQTMVVQ